MNTETIGIILTALGLGGGLIWLVMRLATKPLEVLVKTTINQLETVVDNNTRAMDRIFDILDRHDAKLDEHSVDIARLDERMPSKPPRKRA